MSLHIWRKLYWLVGATYPKDVWMEQQRWNKYNVLKEIEIKVSKDGLTKPSDIINDPRDEEGFEEVKEEGKEIRVRKQNINDKYLKPP